MTRGQAVSEPIQWTIIRLSTAMASREISEFTDISYRKICDILAHFRKTGGINIPKCERPTLHKSLQDEDIQVCICIFTFQFSNWLQLRPVLYSIFSRLLVVHLICIWMSCDWSFKSDLVCRYLYQQFGGHFERGVLLWRRCVINHLAGS